MKSLIALILLAPALASATNPELFITSGTGSLSPGPAGSFEFDASGPGFSTSGAFGFIENGPNPIGIDNPITAGTPFGFFMGSDAGNGGTLGLGVNGIDLGVPDGWDTEVAAGTSALITHPGTYVSVFDLTANFFGEPEGSDVWHIQGQGIVVFDVVADSFDPNMFLADQATFTFEAPEPSTTLLLLVGLAGLAVLGQRRKARESW